MLEDVPRAPVRYRAAKGNIEMRHGIVAALPLVGALAFAGQAHAVTPVPQGTATLWISGGGVSGSVTLTYDIAAGGQDPVVGISGAITDTALGIINQSVTGLIPIAPVVPLPDFVTAPDFSYISVPNGVPSPPANQPSTTLSYDNYYYPGGSWLVCLDYPFFGGVLDVYGLAFTLANDAVDLWSNGVFPGSTVADYGLTFATPILDVDPYSISADQYIAGGITVMTAPEPSTWAMMMLGFAGLGFAGYRKSRKAAIAAV